MSEPDTPSMRPYGRHVLICGHGTCAPGEQAGQLEAAIRAELGDRRRLRNPERVKISVADCLGVCTGGPIVAVYPDGVWYHHVDEALATRIAREHLVGGQPVAEALFHRLYSEDTAVPYAPAARRDAGSYAVIDQTGEAQDEPRSGVPIAGYANDIADAAGISDAEREAKRQQARRANLRKGLVIVNTGPGKGKTTAAVGLITRAWGRNLRTSVIQFIKHSGANYGEVRAAKRMGVPWIGTGDGWTWTSKDLDESAALARHGWTLAQERIASGELDVVLMDEFTYALHFGWLDTTAVIAWLREHKPPMMHLIITGRYAPPALVEYADLVTEMRSIKHPYDTQGIRAQPGVEF